MAYRDILRNSIKTFEDLEKWLVGQKARIDLGYSDGISEDRKGGVITSPLGLGKVYVNDPIDNVEGKPSRHNPNRK